MQAQQAIFTSAQGRKSKGYQIVGMSPGVTTNWSKQIQLWGPSQGAMIDEAPDAESLNCNPIDGQHFAISRTVYGGPEYSRRGELQLFTRFLIFENATLQHYDRDPWSLLRTCWVLGMLRFVASVEPVLPTVEIPVTSLLGCETPTGNAAEDSLTELTQILQMGHPVAMLGNLRGSEHMARVMGRLSPDTRSQLSFTTGLRPSSMRPFKLHFLPSSNGANKHLNRLGITQVCVD